MQVQGAWKTLTSPPQEPREFPRLCRGGLGLPLAVVGGAWTPPGGLCHRRCKALTGGYSRPWDMYGPSSPARGDVNACGRTHVLTTQPTVPSSSWVLPFHNLALSPQVGACLVPGVGSQSSGEVTRGPAVQYGQCWGGDTWGLGGRGSP